MAMMVVMTAMMATTTSRSLHCYAPGLCWFRRWLAWFCFVFPFALIVHYNSPIVSLVHFIDQPSSSQLCHRAIIHLTREQYVAGLGFVHPLWATSLKP